MVTEILNKKTTFDLLLDKRISYFHTEQTHLSYTLSEKTSSLSQLHVNKIFIPLPLAAVVEHAERSPN